MRLFKRKRKGFTLIECIVAMAVFAVMTMMVARVLQMAIDTERDTNRITRDLNAQTQIISSGQIKSQARKTYDIALPTTWTYHRSSRYTGIYSNTIDSASTKLPET
ncbi:MAG: prepilin-type N-terminal cleavage/methylation domain-containing protein, partial [Oscillospiraceae bacterium]|nr:prepilin-type N-terminal cleavage/methylation domain-containing protein [Oscillospiraceae bacterium]